LANGFEYPQKRSNNNQASEVVAGCRTSKDSAPAKYIECEELGDWEPLQETIRRKFPAEDCNIHASCKPSILLTLQTSITLYIHDTGEGQSTFIQSLGKIGNHYDEQNSLVDHPSQSFVRRIVNNNTLGRTIRKEVGYFGIDASIGCYLGSICQL